jgi:hypothetical protein
MMNTSVATISITITIPARRDARYRIIISAGASILSPASARG